VSPREVDELIATFEMRKMRTSWSHADSVMHLAKRGNPGAEAEVESGLIEVVGLNLPLNAEVTVIALQASAARKDLSREIIDVATMSEGGDVRICVCRVVQPVIAEGGPRYVGSETFPTSLLWA
jgi:hypothetical protein